MRRWVVVVACLLASAAALQHECVCSEDGTTPAAKEDKDTPTVAEAVDANSTRATSGASKAVVEVDSSGEEHTGPAKRVVEDKSLDRAQRAEAAAAASTAGPVVTEQGGEQVSCLCRRRQRKPPTVRCRKSNKLDTEGDCDDEKEVVLEPTVGEPAVKLVLFLSVSSRGPNATNASSPSHKANLITWDAAWNAMLMARLNQATSVATKYMAVIEARSGRPAVAQVTVTVASSQAAEVVLASVVDALGESVRFHEGLVALGFPSALSVSLLNAQAHKIASYGAPTPPAPRNATVPSANVTGSGDSVALKAAGKIKNRAVDEIKRTKTSLLRSPLLPKPMRPKQEGGVVEEPPVLQQYPHLTVPSHPMGTVDARTPPKAEPSRATTTVRQEIGKLYARVEALDLEEATLLAALADLQQPR